MINELYCLSTAMERSEVQATSWYREYKPIPNITASKPCIRILIQGGKIVGISKVSTNLGKNLRRFGNNQGFYPGMNLRPLYKITDDSIKKEITALKKQPEKIAEYTDRLKGWCVNDNWGASFISNFKVSIQDRPQKMLQLLEDNPYEPLNSIVRESNQLSDCPTFRRNLELAAFKLLREQEQVEVALSLLFQLGDKTETLSVILDTPELIDRGTPVSSARFTNELNDALLRGASAKEVNRAGAEDIDAFGVVFHKKAEPMPDIKLAGGFDAKLRTMSKNEPCQTRYGCIEDASYPVSPQVRRNLASALNWLGSAEHKDITWINTDKNEILFAYPSQLPEAKISFTRMFKRPEKRDKAFEEQAKQFLLEFRQSKKVGTDSHAGRIQLFILRKIDKGRTKVIYTRQTDPFELERRSEAWTIGCAKNLPTFSFGQPAVPFPLDTADILNRFWKQNGELATDKFKPVPRYHGMELLMESDFPVTSDLHILSEKAMTIGAFLGSKLANHDTHHPIWEKVKDMLALMGLLLYREGIGKDIYMENLPYLYGQLLKASDELHALYCNAVREGDLPRQLAGGSLFQSAAESPIRTLNLLSQRIMPYYTWAKSYRTKHIEEEGKESWRADCLYSQCEEIMTKLHENWTPQTRFHDEEKVQLFIGYLAAFPKKEKAKDIQGKTKEEQSHES